MGKAEEVAASQDRDVAKMAAVPVRNSFAYNVRMTAFSFDYIRLERLCRGVRLDFTKRDRCGNDEARPSQEDEMRSLARSLLARMDEAKDIRITNGEVKHRQSATIRRWKVLAQGGALSKRRASVPFGTVPDSAFNINREGEWAQCCDDPKALDGQAISISTARSGWTVTFDLDNVTFRPNKNYTLKVRARVSKKPGTYGARIRITRLRFVRAYRKSLGPMAMRFGRASIAMKRRKGADR